MNIYGVICAGGIGTRMGEGIPKQFLMLKEKPVIIYSVEKFIENKDIEKLIIAVAPDYISKTKEVVEQNITNKDRDRVIVIEGGDERNKTIMNAIDWLEKSSLLDEETIIVTHDAARPFVSDRMISENIETAIKYGAATTAIPSTDTILSSDDGDKVNQVLDRSKLYNVQTPQSFRAKELRKLYNLLSEDEKKILTDATRIYINKGHDVKIVRGENTNMKITFPEDMEIASAIVK